MVNVANESQSGFDMRWWVEKLAQVCESEGIVDGPAFVIEDRELPVSSDCDALFCHYLKEVQSDTEFIDDKVDVDVYFSSNCMPRKSALTRAN